MKQKEIAETLGISKSYLSMILSGKRRANQELARRLSSLEVHNVEAVSPCKGGALPAELQPRRAHYNARRGLIAIRLPALIVRGGQLPLNFGDGVCSRHPEPGQSS